MDKVIKIEENISETDKLKEKIRSQARKILLLQKRQREPPASCEKCCSLESKLNEVKQQKADLSRLLKLEVVNNELMATIIEASVASSKPVDADWRSTVQQSEVAKQIVENLLRSDSLNRQRQAADFANHELAHRHLSADLATVVQKKVCTDQELVRAQKEIEDLVFNVSIS